MKKFISAVALSLTLSGCQTEIVPLREHVEFLSGLPSATEENVSRNYAIVLELMRYDCCPIIVQDGLREKHLVKVCNDQNKIIYVDVKNNRFYWDPFECFRKTYYVSK